MMLGKELEKRERENLPLAKKKLKNDLLAPKS